MRHRVFFYSILISAAMLLGGASYGRTVKGLVTSGNEKLSNVLVTDGTRFTKTNKAGAFKLKTDKNARFVYIITPSGYAADWSSGVPQFYKKADEGNFFTFDLIKNGEDYSTYNIIAVGDPQPRTKANSDEFDGRPLEDICRTVAELKGPSVGIVLGDICFDVFPLMERWKKSIVRTGIPFYTVPGNHDHNKKVEGDDILTLAEYNRQFGPENHAFHIGKDLVIMLDNIIHQGTKGYKEGYTEQQLNWIRSLLKSIPADADLYIGQHSPLHGRSYMKANAKGIINRDELLDIVKGHKTTFISGHNHITTIRSYGPEIMEHNVASINGSWWDTYHCKDGTPRGYKVFSKTGDELSWYHKAIDRDKDFQYEIIRPGEGQLNPDYLMVSVWGYDPQWTIEWLEDGKPMGQMKQVTEFSPQHMAEIREVQTRTGKEVKKYRRTIKSNHFFAAKPSPDASKITINIKDRFGKAWSEDIILRPHQ